MSTHVFSLNLTRWTTVVNVPHFLSDWKTKDSILYHTQIWWETENVFIPYAWSLLCLSTAKQGFFFFFFSKSIYRNLKILTRAKQASFTPPLGAWGERKKSRLSVLHTLYSLELHLFSQPQAIPIGKSYAMFPTVSASLPSPLSVFSLATDLLFDCWHLLE